MSLALPLLSAGLSALLMLAMAAKWKLPKKPSWPGIAAVSLVSALPFIWVTPRLEGKLGWGWMMLGQGAVSLAIGLALVLLRFWRDPERAPAETDGVVLSAADGEVVYIWKVAEDSASVVRKGGRDYRLVELAGSPLAMGAVTVIGVGMSLMDVHVNRCPIAGQVRLMKHIPGKFLSLGRDEAPFINERLTTVIENQSLSVAVVQIASRLVHCVQSYLSLGESVRAGQRLGMIRFGSLVAIILPAREDVQIEVKTGQTVWAGLSVLARYRE